MKNLTRRDFVKIAGLGLSSSFIPDFATSTTENVGNELSIHIFSKLLHFLDVKEMAEVVKELGFAGIDLTVRHEGHVLPEKVVDDLPKAIEIIQKQGLQTLMMTTGITSSEDETSQKLLKTATKLGIKHYRTGWLKYPEDKSIIEGLEFFKKQFQNLENFNKNLGICASYQNHAGNYLGASIWDFWEVIKDKKTDFLGFQFDIRHATAEGGNSWYQDLQLIYPYIKTLAIKDFTWQKVNNKWQPVSVPIGEGMVDFDKYFKLLQKHKIQVPISLHLEYALGGAENGNRKITIDKKEVFKAMKNDLQKVKELWENAKV